MYSMKYMIIDTREPSEYQQSHVDGAINISSMAFAGGKLPTQLQGITKNQPIILYCRTGARSNTVMQILGMHGFKNLTNGINEHHTRKLIERL